MKQWSVYKRYRRHVFLLLYEYTVMQPSPICFVRDILAFFTLIPHMYSKNENGVLGCLRLSHGVDPWVKSWSEEYKPRGNSRGRLRALFSRQCLIEADNDVWQPANEQAHCQQHAQITWCG